VAVVVPPLVVYPAEKRPADTSGDAVINPDLVLADDLAAGDRWSMYLHPYVVHYRLAR
jgi:hypothetical protein